MIHLRLSVPAQLVADVEDVLMQDDNVVHVVHLRGVAAKPAGDAFSCDVPSEHASVLLHRLRRLGLHEAGGISLDTGEVAVDDEAMAAMDRAHGSAVDAVVWEDVEAKSADGAELSRAFLVFMVIGAVLATVALLLNSPVLMVGAMVVGPEFGPIAAASVAFADRRPRLALRSARALLVGLPLAVLVAWVFTVVGRQVGLNPDRFSGVSHGLASTIAQPDTYTVIVALAAGVAGLLSMSTAKSGPLVGVLVSVTTLPAAANIGVAVGYGDASGWHGSLAQLVLNVALMFAAGVATLVIQRWGYRRRLRRDDVGRRG